MESGVLRAITNFGGVFVVLAFVHFVADWIFQSDYVARNKRKNHWIRFIHCLTYCFWFVIVFLILQLNLWLILGLTLILLVSHFVLDTYKPAIWWLKYIRNPDNIRSYYRKNKELYSMQYLESAIQNNRWLIIMTDQMLHLFFIAIVAFIIGVL